MSFESVEFRPLVAALVPRIGHQSKASMMEWLLLRGIPNRWLQTGTRVAQHRAVNGWRATLNGCVSAKLPCPLTRRPMDFRIGMLRSWPPSAKRHRNWCQMGETLRPSPAIWLLEASRAERTWHRRTNLQRIPASRSLCLAQHLNWAL